MSRLRTIRATKNDQVLHIEAPGCTVNVYLGLRDESGASVTTVEVLPDRKPGAWELAGYPPEHKSACVRVREKKSAA